MLSKAAAKGSVFRQTIMFQEEVERMYFEIALRARGPIQVHSHPLQTLRLAQNLTTASHTPRAFYPRCVRADGGRATSRR